MIKIAICDDEEYIVNQIQEMLQSIKKEKGIEIEIKSFYDGVELEKNISFEERYDLIYLDIEMKTKNGIEAAKAIRRLDPRVLIIYVSGYTKYVEEMLEVEAFRFIKKPILKKKFENYFSKAYEKILDCSECFEFQYKREKFRRLLGDIICFQSTGRTIKICLADGSEEKFNGKINELENRLKGGKIEFLRIHQSSLVSYRYIKSITKTKIILQNDEELNISGDRQKEIRKKHCSLLGGEICD